LESHDVVAEKSYEPSPQQEPQLPPFELPANGMTADAIRIVGLRKSPNEPLVSLMLLVALVCMIVYDHFRRWGSVVVRLDD